MAVSRTWCFTLNNFEDEYAPKALEASYCVWQVEVGASGTPHLQGTCVFKTKKSLAWLNGKMKAHWEIRLGTFEQAKAYCTKEPRVSGPHIYGEEPKQGKRTDIINLKRALEAGKTEVQIAQDDDLFPHWVRNFKAIERYRRLVSAQYRTWATFTIAIWGPPGTGKTRWAFEHFPDAYWLKKPGQGQTAFFDGYEGQEAVVIDEFYGWLPFDLLQRMCDRYPLMVDTKGGMVNFYPKFIVITSNANPIEWYRRGLGAMERRLEGELGQIVYAGEGWSGEIRRCDPPVPFVRNPEAEAIRQRVHDKCNFERCYIKDPIALPEIPLHQPDDDDEDPIALPQSLMIEDDDIMWMHDARPLVRHGAFTGRLPGTVDDDGQFMHVFP